MNKTQLVDKWGRPLANSSFYRSSTHSRERRYIPIVAADSSQTNTPGTRKQLMGVARFLYANSGIAKAAIDSIASFSIGGGLRPSSHAKGENAKLYEDYFNNWSQIADVQNRYTFQQMQYLLSLRVDLDGDCLLLLTEQSDTGLAACQLIESHRVQSNWDDTDYKDGVRMDRWGKPVAYKIKVGDSYRKVSARDAILFMNPDRCDQNRGITALTTAINNIANIEDLIYYETIGVKMNSAIGMVIQNETGEQDAGTAWIQSGDSAVESGGLSSQSFSAGQVPRLKPNESINSFASNKASPVFPNFVSFLIRSLSSGLNLPQEFIWDASGLNGVSTRFILKRAEKTFEQRRQLMINKVVKRVYNYVIAKGIKRKELPKDPDWYKVSFIGDRYPSVDMGRDSQQQRADLLLGTKSLKEISWADGKQWEDLRDQIHTEADNLITHAKVLSEDHGITLDAAISLLSARTSSGQPYTVEPQEDDSQANPTE